MPTASDWCFSPGLACAIMSLTWPMIVEMTSVPIPKPTMYITFSSQMSGVITGLADVVSTMKTDIDAQYQAVKYISVYVANSGPASSWPERSPFG